MCILSGNHTCQKEHDSLVRPNRGMSQNLEPDRDESSESKSDRRSQKEKKFDNAFRWADEDIIDPINNWIYDSTYEEDYFPRATSRAKWKVGKKRTTFRNWSERSFDDLDANEIVIKSIAPPFKYKTIVPREPTADINLTTAVHDNESSRRDQENLVNGLETLQPKFDPIEARHECQTHPNQSIQLCPRECSWHLERDRELAVATDNIEITQLPSSGAPPVDDVLVPSQNLHSSRVFQAQLPRPFAIKTCHILIVLGSVTILGSLVGALWRTEVLDDASGGFALGQYFLEAGALVVGCFTAVHVKYCQCWVERVPS